MDTVLYDESLEDLAYGTKSENGRMAVLLIVLLLGDFLFFSNAVLTGDLIPIIVSGWLSLWVILGGLKVVLQEHLVVTNTEIVLPDRTLPDLVRGNTSIAFNQISRIVKQDSRIPGIIIRIYRKTESTSSCRKRKRDVLFIRNIFHPLFEGTGRFDPINKENYNKFLKLTNVLSKLCVEYNIEYIDLDVGETRCPSCFAVLGNDFDEDNCPHCESYLF